MFETLEDIIVATAAAVRPPERLTVSEAAAKYRMVNNPGSYRGPWTNEMTPYLVEPMDVLSSLEYTAMCFAGPAQSGKALALDTPIATATGWTTMGDIQTGDVIFDEKGEQCTVTFVAPILTGRQCYRLTFDDKTSIVCDEEHVWPVTDCWGAKSNKTTAELSVAPRVKTQRAKGRSRYAIDVNAPLKLLEQDLDLPPYVFGVWLGDGSTLYGNISSGAEDVEEMAEQIRARGCFARIYAPPPGKTAYAIDARGPGGVPIIYHVAQHGLGGKKGNKRIPQCYLRSSVEQRLELLRGLLDSDGSIYPNGRTVSFSSSNRPLFDDVCELLSSLGLKYMARTKETHYPYREERKRGADAHELTFCAYEVSKYFSLARKKNKKGAEGRTTRISQTTRRWVESVEPVDSVPVRCIQVDSPSHLYLAGKQMVPTHNTEIFGNWLTYSAVCDPADMMLVQTSQATARDFSMRRLSRLYKHSPAIDAQRLKGRHSNNTFDTKFISGMLLTLAWPTKNELSGKAVPRMFLTDVDRMDLDIGGEGSPFDLSVARTKTFRRFGMTAAESSPGHILENPRWVRKTPHEAPPTKGILAIYNRGDRRRWYWKCQGCHVPFEPCFTHLQYPSIADKMEAAEQAVMVCPNCGTYIRERGKKGEWGKKEHNAAARWIKDGQHWLPDGSITGTATRSNMASFWLKGPAASFSDWTPMVFNYLKAIEEFELTGDESSLKTTTGTEQALAYIPRNNFSDRLPEDLKARAEPLLQKIVPEGVRFLIAAVDVQHRKFVVQIIGVGVGADMWVVDRFDILKSPRLDDEGHPLWLSPGSYLEDWHVLIEQVMRMTYALGDGSGRRMQIKNTVCDSGGKDGVTTNAYNFWRFLRDKTPDELHRRFHLIKGSGTKGSPRVQVTWPDAQRKDRLASARGEIPVLSINSDQIKDLLSLRLDRREPNGGMINFPDWLGDSFYTELTAESRTPTGWINPKKHRNESWDLFCYAIGLTLSRYVNIESINWDDPPGWAKEWNENDFIFQPISDQETKRLTFDKKDTTTLADLAKRLA